MHEQRMVYCIVYYSHLLRYLFLFSNVCNVLDTRWSIDRQCHLKTCFCSWETKLRWRQAVKSSLLVTLLLFFLSLFSILV